MPERVRPMAKSSSDSPTSMMKMTSAATRNHDDGSVPRQPTHRAAMAARLTARSAVILRRSRPLTARRVGGEPADQGQQHGQIEIVDRSHAARHVGHQSRSHGQREQQVTAVRIRPCPYLGLGLLSLLPEQGGPHRRVHPAGSAPASRKASRTPCSLQTAVASLAEFELAQRDPRPSPEGALHRVPDPGRRGRPPERTTIRPCSTRQSAARTDSGFAARPSCPKSAQGHARRPPVGRRSGRRQTAEQPLARSTGSNVGTSSDRWTTAQMPGHQGSALAHGHPVACGLRWPKVLKGGELIEVPPPNAVDDGHSIALVGYVDNAQNNGGVFLFRNSWGPEWGKNGYGSISYAYTQDLRQRRPLAATGAARFRSARATIRGRRRCPWWRPAAA